MSKKPSILIVGAGASGIAAATKLYENGFTDIKILEAENRIGGRIYSVDFGGSIVDLGGQWVHGEEGNIVYQMVKDMDLLSPSFNTYDDMTFYLSNGAAIDKHLTDRIFKIGSDVWHDEEEAKNNPGAFGKYFVKRFMEDVRTEFGDNQDAITLSCMCLEWFEKFFLCLDSAKSWNDVSTNGVFTFKSCEGNQQLNWRDKGYRTILYILMKKIPDITKQIPLDNNILLNKEVKAIIWDDPDGLNQVEVHCADGSSYNADHVIVTTSVGVLKKFYKDMFKPRLPPLKINAIDNITLGTVNKILLKFPRKWWPNDVKGFSLLWTDEDKSNLINEVPHYAPAYNAKPWILDVFGFYVIDSHPRVLLGWITGQLAAEVEKLSDEVVIENCMYLLRKFAGHKYDIPRAEEVLRSKWNSNPHFNGSYTFVSIKQEEFQATADHLAEPLVSKNGKQAVLFAGEATSASHYSTVHGAIETGYREADRIIKLYKTSQHVSVVILGAGMAGLGAASKLMELGYEDFLLIEATSRPGGRIKTVYVDNKPVDLGAQWIHGKDNLLYKIAEKHDLLSKEKSFEGLGLFIRNDGVVFDEFLVKKVDWEIGKILEQCEEFLRKQTFPQSVGEFLNQKFQEYLTSSDDPDEIKTMKLQLYDWHLRFQIIDNSCCSLNQVSAKAWGSYICLDDISHFNLKRGFQSLIDVIIKDIPKDKFLFDTPVDKINYQQFPISIDCFDRCITCDNLILTPSLAVLKKLDIRPNFPSDIKEAVDRMGFHGIGKIFLFFKERWWRTSKGFQFLWDANMEFLESDKWIRHLTGFDEVFNSENALLGWIGGEGLKQMEELDEEEIGRICVKFLKVFLPDYDVPEPVKVIRTRWLTDQWVQGSYCHITPECDTGFDISTLAQPIAVGETPRILLAGEAVHTSHYSTAHGAFESGQQQAQFLYEAILKDQNIL